MKAALCLISGEGELEKGWNKLFGNSRGLPSVSGTGVDSKPPGVLYSIGSLFAVCPKDEAALLPNPS